MTPTLRQVLRPFNANRDLPYDNSFKIPGWKGKEFVSLHIERASRFWDELEKEDSPPLISGGKLSGIQKVNLLIAGAAQHYLNGMPKGPIPLPELYK